MNILLLGATGQVGYELQRSLQGLGDISAPPRAQLDLADLASLDDAVRALRPALIVNAAAYTAVEQAESEPELAFRINAEAPAVLAREARALGAAMIHYSTDYVFDGRKNGPYKEDDAPAPLNVYGRSKLAGERAISESGISHLILRTSWVYGMRGNNFLLTMLKRALEHGQLRVVADQFGAPTWSRTIAEMTAHLVAEANAGCNEWWRSHSGIYHLACAGQTSWHGFAQAIMAAANIDCTVEAIASADYPSRVQRPRNSVLDCRKLASISGEFPDWQSALKLCLS